MTTADRAVQIAARESLLAYCLLTIHEVRKELAELRRLDEPEESQG